ncbi:hypothetical protein [Methylomonas fluvii]|nr:hypothetical protein [Methylomonas fluvii]
MHVHLTINNENTQKEFNVFLMNDEITIEHQGKSYSAEFVVHGDTLIMFLPDGSQKETELRGLKPEFAAKTHLRSYISNKKT